MTGKSFEMEIIGSDGSRDLELYEISAEERKGKKSLGVGLGTDIGHCVYLAIRHCKSFERRAKWYYIFPDDDKELQKFREETGQTESIMVGFYG